MRKSKLKQTLSMLLAVLMVFMSMNFSVFAEELDNTVIEPTTSVVETPDEPTVNQTTPSVEAPAPVEEKTETTDDLLQQKQPALLRAPVPNGTPIAKIDEQEYTDQAAFLQAFKDLTGQHTVQLLADIALSQVITVPSSVQITLDLNGCKINMSSNNGMIINEGKLTIHDATSVKNGAIENTPADTSPSSIATIYNKPGANLTVESGTVSSTTGTAIKNEGTAGIHGGTIKTTGANNTYSSSSATAAIQNYGALDISKQEGNENAALIATNQALPVWISSKSSIQSVTTISYGDFRTEKEKVNIKINSGHSDCSVTVTGGTWDRDPSAYIAPNCSVSENAGIYSVTQSETQVKDVTSLQALKTALQAARDSWQNINITEDITVTEDLEVPDKAYLTIQSGKTLKIKNNSKVDLKGCLKNLGTLDISEIGSGWINDITRFENSGQISGLPNPENGVYKISTINQLQFMHFVMLQGNSEFKNKIELQNPIDATGYRFMALGDSSNGFAGTFDGKKQLLNGLTIHTIDGNASLFNTVYGGANFIDLNFKNCDVNTTNGYLGILAGESCGPGTIIVKNSEIAGQAASATSFYCGGLIGSLWLGDYQFENCQLDIDINGFANVGPFWGSATGTHSNISIVNCSNSGNITCEGKTYGIVGGYGYGNYEGIGPLIVALFGYDYTGTVTVNGQVVETPQYCTSGGTDKFITAVARAQQSDKSYQYFETLQTAIEQSADNSVIEIAPGTYNLESTLRIEKPLTLKGLGNVVITRGDAWTPAERSATDAETGSLILINNTKDVTLENITVQGAKKITGSVNANGHGINIVQSTNVTLSNITSKDNAAAGVVVNGSIVTATGLYTSGNGWYGVNVDQGSGVTADTDFTLNQPSRLGERLPIVSDKFASSDNIFVNAEGFAQRDYKADDGHTVVYWINEAALIKNVTKNKTYTSIQEAINDAIRGNVIEIPAGVYKDELTINKAGLTLQKAAGEGDCVLDGSITAESRDLNLKAIKAGENTAVNIKKGANLKLDNSTGFDEGKKITVEKLFGTEYDTSIVKLNGADVAKEKLGFTYLGEEIQPDFKLFKADEVSYTVKTPAQFYWLSQQINAGAEGFTDTSKFIIKLGNNLDFHDDEWLPVGAEGHDYKGTFDGQGKTISNLYINRPGENYLALFGTANNNNTLGNVTFNKVTIIGKSVYNGERLYGGQYAGSLVGRLSTGTVDGVIVNNYSFNSDIKDTVAGSYNGGVVGSAESISLSNCSVNTGKFVTRGQNVGGIIGYIGSDANIMDCHGNNINIAENSTGDAGGVIGTATTGTVKVYYCSIKDSSIRISTPSYIEPDYTYRGELIGEMRSGTLYLYDCTSENTTAINVKVPNDKSQLVGGVQSKIKTLTVYNENNKTPYATIQEAINNAHSGDTIKIGTGTYDEAVNLTKAVNLIGPNADTNPNGDNDQPAERAEEAILTGGINITRSDSCTQSISIKGLKFRTNGIYSVGWGNDPNLDSITIENNVFENIVNKLDNNQSNVSAIHFNLANSQPVQNCTIKNNRISGVGNGDSSGINVFVVSGTTTITDNYIENTNHSSLQIPGKAIGNVTITGNTFKNWDQDVANGGRAMRFGDFSDVTSLTVNQNKMIRNKELGKYKDQMAAFVKAPSDNNKTLDLSLNYWNGKLPETTYGEAKDNSVIVVSEGTAKINALPYYIDEAMTKTRVPAEVFEGVSTTSKGQYLTIQEAIDADSTVSGDTIQLAEGTFTEQFTLNKSITLKGDENGNTILQCTVDPIINAPNDNGQNAAVLAMSNNITAKVQNVAFDITKTGQSPISFNCDATLTVENCRFTGSGSAEYGTNAIYGGGHKDATVIFKDNTFEIPYRMAITSLGKNSEVTGNTFNIGTDRVIVGDKEQRTSILTVVAAEGTVNISDNIFMGANRAIGVDHSKLNADKLTIKNNQFIDVRYGLELSSKENAECGNYDLSENYYATTTGGTEVASAMLVEDANASGASHFDDTSKYTGDQVNLYPYYIDKAMTKLYAPIELRSANGQNVKYFGTVNDAFAEANDGDTVVINQTPDGQPATINEPIDMNVVSGGKLIAVNLQLEGSTTFGQAFTGTTKGHLILSTSKDADQETIATFNGSVDGFVSVDAMNFDSAKAPVIKALSIETDKNSFISKTGVLNVSEEGDYRVWTYGSPSDHFNGGDGTQAKPYQINTADQLKLLAKEGYDTQGLYYKLTNDITLSDWTPLSEFKGSFDGNGYSITGNKVSFINVLAAGAKVEKLRFEGFTNLVNTNNGTIENCFTLMGDGAVIVGTNNTIGAVKDSFTAGPIAVNARQAENAGQITKVYYCEGATSNKIGTAMTKAEMQKARFGNTLNSGTEGVWDYDAAVEASAYPFVIKDGGKTTIQNLGEVTVTCDSNIGSVTVKQPEDGLYLNDEVTLSASIDNQFYDFGGWYIKTKLLSPHMNYTYQVKSAEDVGEITGTFVEKEKTTITALVMDGNGKVSIDDSEPSNLANATSYVGSMTTLKAIPNDGYRFAKWTTLTDTTTIVSTDPTFTFRTGTGQYQYIAWFEKVVEDQVKVTFTNGFTGAVMDVQTIKKGTDVTPPTPPTYAGKEFDGWYKDGTKVELVDGKIKNVTSDMTLEARFKAIEKLYTIKVENGTISGTIETQVQKKFDDAVTIVANKPEENMNFAGWSIDGSIVSYDATYTFYVKGNTIITATYADKPIEPQPTVFIDPNVTQFDQGAGFENLYKLQFVIRSNIPEDLGYTPVKCGIVFRKADVLNPDELSINGTNVTVGGKTDITNIYTYTATIGKLPVGQVVSARGYLTYMKNGITETIYTDMVKGTVKTVE